MWKNIAFAFKPDKPEYRAPGDTWNELPDKVYHVAPRHLRESIDKEGLNSKGRDWNFATQHAQWADDQYQDEDTREQGYTYRPSGVYTSPASTIHEVKKHLEGKTGKPFDIYEIDTKSLRSEKDNPTDVIRDPEVFQGQYEPEAGISKEEFWHNMSDSQWQGEDDWRSWAFEHVPKQHIKQVKPYTIKSEHKWQDEDYEDYMEDHPEDEEESA